MSDHDASHKRPDGEKPDWFDNPKNINLLIWVLLAACVLVFAADALYEKHPHFDVENVFGFYGIYGFVAFGFIVFVGVLLRKVVMRDEDYYDR